MERDELLDCDADPGNNEGYVSFCKVFRK